MSEATLTVSGEGRLAVKADTAWVSLGVLTVAKFADDAARGNAAVAAKVIGMVRTLGVDDGQIATTTLVLYPTYDKEEQISDYRAETAIRVECPIELAGKVFDTGIASGATQSSNLEFGLRDESAARAKALAAAVQAAQQDAEAVATALRLRLHAPRVVESDPVGGPILIRSAERSGAPLPVVAPPLTIDARVKIVYGLG
jgi:uncharacterized protein YggE